MFPEAGDEERTVCTGKRFLNAPLIIEIGSDDFHALSRQCFGFVGIDITGDGPDFEFLFRVIEDGTDEAAALCAGCAEYCDEFLFGHESKVLTMIRTKGKRKTLSLV